MEKVRFIKLFKNYYKEFYVAQTKVVRDKRQDNGHEEERSNHGMHEF